MAPAAGGFAALQPGTLGRWQTLGQLLNTARLGHVAQVAGLNDGVNDRTFIYAAVGRGGSGLLDTVERAEVTVSIADGSLVISAWTVETQVVPTAREFAGVALADASTHPNIDPAQDFYLFVVEGSDGGFPNPGLRSVAGAATAATDGSLGTWTVNSNDAPTAHFGNSAVVGNGSVYVICGVDATSSPSTDLRRGPLQADGNVTAWADSSTKPANARAYQVVIVGRSFLYIIGGETPTGETTGDVEQIPF